jgi:hypothetical protein
MSVLYSQEGKNNSEISICQLFTYQQDKNNGEISTVPEVQKKHKPAISDFAQPEVQKTL